MRAAIKRFKDRVWHLLCERMNLNWTLPSGVTVVIRSYADWCIYNEIFTSGEYDPAILETLDAALSSQTVRVLDLGANLGYFSLRFADLAIRRGIPAEINLVEGAPGTARQLEKRLSPIRPSGMELRVFAGLAGRKNGSGKLHLGREGNVNYVGDHDGGVWNSFRGSVDVPYVNLDEFFTGYPVDLLKCDIEGSEFEMFENYPALLARTRRLVIEFHTTLGDVEAAKRLLRDAGFLRLTELRKDGLTSVCFATR